VGSPSLSLHTFQEQALLSINEGDSLIGKKKKKHSQQVFWWWPGMDNLCCQSTESVLRWAHIIVFLI